MKNICIYLIAMVSCVVSAADENRSKVLGYLEPYRLIDMTCSEVGLIAEVNIKEGAQVKTGQLLMSLNISEWQARLKIAQIQAQSSGYIAVAKADLDVAKDRYSKLLRLQRSGTSHSSEVSRGFS